MKDGQISVVAGWGRTTNNYTVADDDFERNKVSVETLKFLKVPIANGKCGPGDHFTIDPTIQLCAGGESGKDSCSGDSGGPLWINEANETSYQIGLVSYGTRDCGVGEPGVYTKVTNYLPWIESKLQP